MEDRMQQTLMSRLCATTCLAVTVAGCGTEPLGPVLEGQFADTYISLTADQSGVLIRFPCSSARTGPLRQRGDSVDATGSYSSGFSPPVPFTVLGQVTGDTLVLSTSIFTAGDTVHDSYVLYRDSTRDFSGTLCVAGS
jgi:hypothetical protein